MPELPQVQGFVNYFQSTSLHKKIKTTFCKEESLIENTSASYLQTVLKGQAFKQVYRRGKYLITKLSDDKHFLVMHFGMTGTFNYKHKRNLSDEDKQYAIVIFEFDDDYQLLFNNKRKLGSLYLTTSLSNIESLNELGPEPFDFDEETFISGLNEHKTKNIKSFLMDQTLIAGIGNEFSNEILFQTEINPHKKIEQLKEEEKKNLLPKIKNILNNAVAMFKSDKDAANYPDDWLLAHQKEMKCPKNPNHSLKKETIAGRSAIFCPEHQCN